MAGYRREVLLDDEGADDSHIVFSSNLTSIGNPHFTNVRHQLVLDDTSSINDQSMNNGVEMQSTSTTAAMPTTTIGVSNDNLSVSFIHSSSYERKRIFWSRMTQFEKLLSMVIAVLGIVVFTLAIVLLMQPSPLLQVHLTKEDQGPCLTPECISIASSIINSLDTSVDPCNDFYSFACGGWIKSNPIPEGHSSWGTFGKLTQDNQLVLKNVIEDPTRKFSGAEHKVKLYYESCMDRNGTIEKLGSKPLQEFIDLIGGWNISGGFDVRAWNLQSKLTLMSNKYNRGNIFDWTVDADQTDSTKNIIVIAEGELGLPRDYYLNKTDDDPIIIAYVDYMTKIGVLLGGEESSTRQQMKQVLALERELAQILPSMSDARDDKKRDNHKMSLKDLIKLSPFLDWVAFYREAFAPIRRNITENEIVLVNAQQYLGNLSNLFNDYLQNDTKKTTLVNTLVWSAIYQLSNYLSKPFRDATKAFNLAMEGTEGQTNRWRNCIAESGSVLSYAIGSMFVRSAFRIESKNESAYMIQMVKDAFKEHLHQIKWMDPKTLQLASEKTDAITDIIGYPDFIMNEKRLNKRYEGLMVKEDQFFRNTIASNIFTLSEVTKKLDKPGNQTESDVAPSLVNAFYMPSKNQIAFPAGIMQLPFYDVNRPKSINFGSMGFVMGHEMIHGFDDEGREYDKRGNLHEWWENSTILKFNENMKCFQDQYSKFQVGTDFVNGKQTLGENVADNGGMSSSFHAFTKWSKHNEETIILPGLNYTQDQLFFIGFAQLWCTSITPEALRLQLRNDPHPPTHIRVRGTISNSIDFANVYECPPNSPMNPIDKCVLW